MTQVRHTKGTAHRAKKVGERTGLDSYGATELGINHELTLHRYTTFGIDDASCWVWAWPAAP